MTAVIPATTTAGTKRSRDWYWTVGGIVTIVVLWQLLAKPVLDDYSIPSPVEILRQLNRDRDVYPSAVWATVKEGGRGWLIGNVLATSLAAIAVAVPRIEKLITRFGIATYTVPVLAIGPILKVTVGRSTMIATLAALAVFFTTMVGAILGLKSADRRALDLIKALGGSSFTALTKVRLRSALPAYFAALRISAPAALLGTMVAEWFAPDRGLGAYMINAMALSNSPRVWGVALMATLTASIGYMLIALVGWWLTRWDTSVRMVARAAR